MVHVVGHSEGNSLPSIDISCLGQATYVYSVALATSSKYMREGGNFTKLDHEIFITKMNILVSFNIFMKFSDNENLKIYGTLPRFPI